MCPEHINQLTREQQRTLWHMRLNHMNHGRVCTAHKFADGIPHLPKTDVLHKCPLCARAKLHKASRVAEDDKFDPDKTDCWEHVQIDFGFMVQRSRRRREKRNGKKAAPRPDDKYYSSINPQRHRDRGFVLVIAVTA